MTTLTSPPLVLTAAEVAVALRIIDADASPEQSAAAIRCVHRLTREGRLRALKPSKEYVYPVAALEQYIAEATEPAAPEQSQHPKARRVPALAG